MDEPTGGEIRRGDSYSVGPRQDEQDDRPLTRADVAPSVIASTEQLARGFDLVRGRAQIELTFENGLFEAAWLRRRVTLKQLESSSRCSARQSTTRSRCRARRSRSRLSPTEDEPTCAYAGCDETATVALRFGDGSTNVGARQTAVGYCDTHAELVKRLFVTCDERSLVATFVATPPVSPSPDQDKAPR